MILNGPGISYTEPDIGSEFVPPLPEHPREAIVKLCEHCTNRLLHRDELLGYEYWSFAEAATDEQAEVLCKKLARPAKGPAEPAPIDTLPVEVEESLKEVLGSEVNVAYHGGKGRLTVHLYSDEQLRAFANRLGQYQQSCD